MHLESYFGEAKADLYEQLFLTAGVRADASSTFGKSVRRNYFPKASAAWEFTRALGRTSGTGVLSYGKLRVGYGQTGREPTPYQVFSGFSASGFNDGWTNGLNANQAGNAALTLSTTKGQDVPEARAQHRGGVRRRPRPLRLARPTSAPRSTTRSRPTSSSPCRCRPPPAS